MDSDCQTAVRDYCMCEVYTHFKTVFITISKRKLNCILNKKMMKEMR